MIGPRFLKACGAIGLTGLLTVVAADIVSWFLAENYNPLSQTISTLAIGPSSWLIDVGLWAFALACAAIGIGMMALRSSGRRWVIASFSVTAVGVDVVVISVLNDYAGQEKSAANPHTWAVGALYVLFALAALSAASGLRRLSEKTGIFSRLSGWAWIVLGPVFYFWYPSGWLGACERGLALLMVIWLAVAARTLYKEAVRGNVSRWAE